MPLPVTSEASPTANVVPARHTFRRVWVTALCALAAIPIFYAALFTIYWPFTKQDIITTLQERSLRAVTIGRFRTTYFPPGCIAEQVKFLRIKRKDKAPLLTMDRLEVSTSYRMLFTFQRRIGTVRVDGLHLTVPAKEPAGEPSPIMPLTYSDSKTSMPIDTLYADGAVLEFERISNPKPLRIAVSHLAIHNIRSDAAFTYDVRLENSEPPGAITSSGAFGPWNPKDTGSVPLHGNFKYTDVNLAFFREFSGTLAAEGQFNGSLARVNVSGKAEIPNFRLADARARALSATYQAAVNALHGDAELNKVVADFDRTSLLATGSIMGVKGGPGKAVSLDVSSGRGRIEDLTSLFLSNEQPPMTGDLAFHLHSVFPTGSGSVLRALTASGSFGIYEGQFADKQTEAGLARLSQSTKSGKEKAVENAATLLSDVKGQVTAADGIARLSHIEFEIPGAHAWINGTYNLLARQSDLRGVLITKGDVADTETGFKSILLKALTPFFKRKNHSKIVPFKIAGPAGHTAISLDTSRLR